MLRFSCLCGWFSFSTCWPKLFVCLWVSVCFQDGAYSVLVNISDNKALGQKCVLCFFLKSKLQLPLNLVWREKYESVHMWGSWRERERERDLYSKNLSKVGKGHQITVEFYEYQCALTAFASSFIPEHASNKASRFVDRLMVSNSNGATDDQSSVGTIYGGLIHHWHSFAATTRRQIHGRWQVLVRSPETSGLSWG